MGSFARELAADETLGRLVVHARTIPAIPARTARTERPLPKGVRGVLERMGIAELYAHQARAIDLIRDGRDVAVVTPTASGKSLVFTIPTIEAALADPGSRALYLFPYKALEQDQQRSLKELGRALFSGIDLTCEVYDGDTPAAARRRIKAHPPDVLITNPDMLHMGLLAYHADWRMLFEKLRFVVVDELHVYRGIFGAHLAHVLRRLWRIAEHYGASPRLIVASASIGNPGEFARALTGRDVEIVSESGAPRAARHFLFVNPAESPYTAATETLARSVKAGFKTIAFTKARRITELMHSWLLGRHPDLAGRVASYRAGYLPEERRAIEARLFRGELDGVISTSALELGIDVGGLDVCLLVGYPGSIMSAWQRIGRVGRTDRESLTVLFAMPDALDQYFMKRPGEFFDRPFEQAAVDPANPVIAAAHLVCAGAELPIREAEHGLWAGSEPVFQALEGRGKLLRDAEGGALISLQRRPQRDVSLRSTGSSFAIVDVDKGRTIGSIDGVRVHHECHEGAIYLHAGQTWLVRRLDLDARKVEAVPADVDYYTQVAGEKETEILETLHERDAGRCRLGIGRLKVTVRIQGYERRRLRTQEPLSRHPLDVPPIVFETVGFWLAIPEALDGQITRGGGHFMGALHGAEHAMISLLPLFALCDRNDVGGISYSRNPQLGQPAIFIYDGYPGGIGLTSAVAERVEELIDRTITLLATCPCEDGCPSCVQSPKCGNGNRPLDKTGARRSLEVMSGGAPLEEAAPGEEPAAPRPEAVRTPPRVPAARIRRAPLPGDASPRWAPDPEAPRAPQPAPRDDGRLLFLDVETQRSAEEVGGWGNISAMGLALAVVHEPGSGEYRCYFEKDVERLLVDLLSADAVVGYNIDRFDMTVLSAYTPHDLGRVRTVDMLTLVRQALGFRVSLGHLAEVNLGEPKSADGLQSLRWWKEGRMDLIEAYCRKDVELTARLFYLGREKGHLLCRDRTGRPLRVPVSW